MGISGSARRRRKLEIGSWGPPVGQPLRGRVRGALSDVIARLRKRPQVLSGDPRSRSDGEPMGSLALLRARLLDRRCSFDVKVVLISGLKLARARYSPVFWQPLSSCPTSSLTRESISSRVARTSAMG